MVGWRAEYTAQPPTHRHSDDKTLLRCCVAAFLRINRKRRVPNDLTGSAPPAARLTLRGRAGRLRPTRGRHGRLRLRRPRNRLGGRDLLRWRRGGCRRRRYMSRRAHHRARTDVRTRDTRYCGRMGRGNRSVHTLARRHDVYAPRRGASQLHVTPTRAREIRLEVVAQDRLVGRMRARRSGKTQHAERQTEMVSHVSRYPGGPGRCPHAQVTAWVCAVQPPLEPSLPGGPPETQEVRGTLPGQGRGGSIHALTWDTRAFNHSILNPDREHHDAGSIELAVEREQRAAKEGTTRRQRVTIRRRVSPRCLRPRTECARTLHNGTLTLHGAPAC